MRAHLALLLLWAPVCTAARIDATLEKFIPPDANSLFGARMDQLRATPMYRKLVAQNKLPQMDQFAEETGFDPRTDVQELLVASTTEPNNGVLVARGAFHVKPLQGARTVPYRGYHIVTPAKAPPGGREGGFLIIDGWIAVAGPVERIKSAVDQYKKGGHGAPATLLDKARSIPEDNQVWAVSLGGLNFVADHFGGTGNGVNFGRIFRSLEQTRFQADLRTGFRAVVLGSCKSAEDAKNLGDAARGVVGLARLQTPDNQPELLKIWDGVQVKQEERQISIVANIPQALIDKLVAMFQSGEFAGAGRRKVSAAAPR